MVEIISCPEAEPCSCLCNCIGVMGSGHTVTVGDLVIDENQYTFSYTFTNEMPTISHVIFCICCPESKIILSSSNTSVVVTGFTETGTDTVPFSVEFDFGDEEMCCPCQGIKVNVAPGEDIVTFRIDLIFTLPEGLAFCFHCGNMRVKAGQLFNVINHLCLPGCLCDECSYCETICEIWRNELFLIQEKEETFIHMGQLLLPDGIDLSDLTASEIDDKIRLIANLECSIANLNCDIAKVLAALRKMEPCCWDTCCPTNCG